MQLDSKHHRPTSLDTLKLRPGQLWVWDFDVKAAGTEGWWFATRVTSEGRHLPSFAVVMLERGDLVLCITPDDPGPYQLPTIPNFNFETGESEPVFEMVKRYHVFMKGDTLIWFEHNWLEQCILVADPE